MTELNKDAIEQNLIDLLMAQGYAYCYGNAFDALASELTK